MRGFSDSFIRNLTPNVSVYKRGVTLVSKILEFEYYEDDNTIHAVVEGTYDYNVFIEFNKSGSLKSYSCECEAYNSYFGACKHVIAVMNYANRFFDEDNEQVDIFSDPFRGVLPLSELGVGLVKKYKTKASLWISNSLTSGRSMNLPYIELQLKVGIDRPYIIKSIPDFLDSLDKGRITIFGKKFTLDPSEVYFDGFDKELLDFISDLYRSEKNRSNFLYPYYYDTLSIFNKNTVMLFEDNLKRYFELVKNRKQPINFFGDYVSELRIYDDFDINIKLEEKEGLMLLEANYNEDEKIAPLTSDFEYIFNPYKHTIYKIPKEKTRLIEKIHGIRQRKKKPVFRIDKQEQESFFRGFFSDVKKACRVTIDPQLEEKIIESTLIPKVYFDVFNEGICARIDFCYGEKVINPFDEHSGNDNSMLLMRNYEQEEQITGFLNSAGMVLNKGFLIMQDEEDLVEFINHDIDKLKEMAEVYYSEEFKEIKVRSIGKVQLGVRLNTESNLLEFDFDVEDFDDGDLTLLLNSIREKKKYYRLKSGSILNLNNKELNDISGLLNDLCIDTKSFKDGIVNLPANRALFIDNYVNDKKIKSIKRNKKYEQLVKEITNPKDLSFEPVDGLEQVLREYQKFGFKWLKTLSHYGFGGILADDMGLGKTLQVLAFIKDEMKIGNNKPCLVVAPTSLVYNWKDEVSKFVPELRVNVVHGIKAERIKMMDSFCDSDILVTSYGALKRDIDRYKDKEFSYIFVDEAQHIKNPKTINASSVKSLRAKGYFALTGTPIENSLTELWSIFDFVMPGYLLNHNKFVEKFEKPIVRNNDKEALKTLSRFIKPFVLRRLKGDVLKELPDKIESKMVADMSLEQKKLYIAYLKKAKGEIAAEIEQKGMEKSRIKILAALTRLRQICCHPATFIEGYNGTSGKLESLKELLENSIDSGHRVLLFSQFTAMLEIIGRNLKNSGIPYFYLDGSTNARDRIDMVNRFNSGEKSIFLISLKAGGTGLNLTGADMVIHYDPWWNPAVEDQATDRAYRMGQTKAVQVFKMITKDTIEEKIFKLQEKKRGLINSIIKPGENLLTKLGEEEIRELFQL